MVPERDARAQVLAQPAQHLAFAYELLAVPKNYPPLPLMGHRPATVAG